MEICNTERNINEMKQLLFAFVAVFLLFVPNASAHTYLDTTIPEDGATVTTALQSIELTYQGKIEEGSTFKVIASDGAEMAIEAVTLKDGVLTGTLVEPLPNDSYKVEWESISKDGHPLSGSFSFTVNAPVVTDQPTENDAAQEIEAELEEPSAVDTNEETEDNSSSTPLIIVGILLVLIILVSLLTLAKRNKTK